MTLSSQAGNEPTSYGAALALWGESIHVWRKHTYSKHDRVISHGDASEHLWVVLSGWVKLTRQTPDGKETVIGLCSDGDFFGEAALFPHGSYPYTAEVLSDNAELAILPATTLRELIATKDAVSVHVMRLMHERTLHAQLKLEHMTTMSAAQRLGCFLLQLCHTQTDGAKTLHIPVEKHILAAYLGMKAETFSRSQQQINTLGISVAGNTVTVSDISKLRAFVCGSCSKSGSCDVEDAAH